MTWTFRAIETGENNVTNTASASIAADPGIPSAASQAGLTTPDGTPLNIALAGGDPDGGTLSYIIVTPPTKGTLSAGTGASRTFPPAGGVYGADQFTFKVNDGKYDSAPATVRLTILTPPIAPTSVIVNDTTVRPENVTGDFLSTISSPDRNVGEAHTFTLASGAGSEENGSFISIVGNQLRAATSFAALTGVPQRIRIRSTDASGLTVEGSFVLSVTPKPRGIVINELHYNSAVNNIRNAFVELYNNGATAVNLAGWRLSGQVDYTFPAGTTLAPGAHLVVEEDPATILAYWGKTALGPWNNATVTYPDGSKESNNLSNDGGTIRLRNAADAVVSSVDYDNHSPWPAAGNGEGSSIELINPGLDESHGSNWAAAKGAGGPAPDVTYVAAATSGWKYFKGTTAPAATWKDLVGADLTGWLDGTTTVGNATTPYFGFGYGDNDDAVVLSDMQQITTPAQTGYQAVYFRKTFDLPAGQIPPAFALRVYVDDGCIVYINGVEIPTRFFCGAGTPTHATDATTIGGVAFTNHEAAPNNWASYGNGKPVAGAWQTGNKLSNGGDQLNLKYGDATLPFYTTTYDDAAPWPLTPDGNGPSLVLLAPETRPNPNIGANWRASYSAGGNPGGDDRPGFTTWAGSNSVGSPGNDEDGDGISNLLEYGLVGNPNGSSQSPLPTSTTVNDYLTLTFRRLQDPADISYSVEFTDSFGTPFTAGGTMTGSADNGDGTLTQTWRAPAPGAQYFGRVKVVKP